MNKNAPRKQINEQERTKETNSMFQECVKEPHKGITICPGTKIRNKKPNLGI